MNKKQFLAISLPYDLKFSIATKVIYVIDEYKGNDYVAEFEYKNSINTPILHPLSDLTKPITHKGETFMPQDRLIDADILINGGDYKLVRMGDIEKLIEWHFDLFGGIDSGDAIDVNLLQENPYK